MNLVRLEDVHGTLKFKFKIRYASKNTLVNDIK